MNTVSGPAVRASTHTMITPPGTPERIKRGEYSVDRLENASDYWSADGELFQNYAPHGMRALRQTDLPNGLSGAEAAQPPPAQFGSGGGGGGSNNSGGVSSASADYSLADIANTAARIVSLRRDLAEKKAEREAGLSKDTHKHTHAADSRARRMPLEQTRAALRAAGPVLPDLQKEDSDEQTWQSKFEALQSRHLSLQQQFRKKALSARRCKRKVVISTQEKTAIAPRKRLSTQQRSRDKELADAAAATRPTFIADTKNRDRVAHNLQVEQKSPESCANALAACKRELDLMKAELSRAVSTAASGFADCESSSRCKVEEAFRVGTEKAWEEANVTIQNLVTANNALHERLGAAAKELESSKKSSAHREATYRLQVRELAELSRLRNTLLARDTSNQQEILALREALAAATAKQPSVPHDVGVVPSGTSGGGGGRCGSSNSEVTIGSTIRRSFRRIFSRDGATRQYRPLHSPPFGASAHAPGEGDRKGYTEQLLV